MILINPLYPHLSFDRELAIYTMMHNNKLNNKLLALHQRSDWKRYPDKLPRKTSLKYVMYYNQYGDIRYGVSRWLNSSKTWGVMRGNYSKVIAWAYIPKDYKNILKELSEKEDNK